MKVTIESTAKIVTLIQGRSEIAARVWQGATESGIPVQFFVTRIAPEIPKNDPLIDELTAEFSRELKRCADPRISVDAIPLRMLI
jgi:hypothetical protein